MICSQDYILKYVNGIPYLLPYGQMVADMRRALKLNETGVFLWNELSDARESIVSCQCQAMGRASWMTEWNNY